MGNNMGYGQEYGNMNNFRQLAGRFLSRAPQNIRNYFTNYSKYLTPTTVPTMTKAYTSGNSQKIGNALRRAREFILWNHSNKSGETHKQKILSGIKSRSTDKNHENYTSSGLREQQNALDKPYENTSKIISKHPKIFTLMEIAHKKSTIIMRTCITPKDSTTQIAIFQKVHMALKTHSKQNFRHSQLRSKPVTETVNVNMKNVRQ